MVGEITVDAFLLLLPLPLPLLLLTHAAQSGIPSDPNCQRMSIQNSTAVYDAAAETVSITFDTSTASTCVCKVPAIGQRKRNCK